MANGYAGYAVKGGKARIGADCVCLRLCISVSFLPSLVATEDFSLYGCH